MKRVSVAPWLSSLLVVLSAAGTPASECCDGPCYEPRCRAEWEEHTTKKSAYTITCEHACARARDRWHAPDPECRRHPPCGKVYVKKRLYKQDGKETVERVPKYEVEMTPTGRCHCPGCRGPWAHLWGSFDWFAWFRSR